MTRRRLLPLLLVLVAGLTAFAGLSASGPASAADPCAAPVTNQVACENTKPGDPANDWQVSGIGDSTIQGFATSMSVNKGQSVSFKIKTPASAYHIDILRLGYYGGDGARIIASNITPSASLPQTQPACLTSSATGLIDCGNWGVSASWNVPSTAVSGLYIAHLVRNDTGGESQIFFVVRDDTSHADVLMQTSDATWQAYNAYGGNSLYTCTVACPAGNPLAYKAAYSVSYNRPFDGTIATDGGESDPFYSEYQLIRFMERNGYDMSYTSGADVDASAALVEQHKVFVSSGHDEYWSKGQRQNVEAARDAGVNLAFFSGNEVFWKTRWQNSSDASNTPYRTLTTYKETHFDAKVDPQANTWTGTWRDPRFSPPGDGGKPENSLTGQYFIVNSGTSDIKVPGTFANLRFWRNTPVANLTPAQTLTLSPGTGNLGYEWDVDSDNGFRPGGRFPLSSTTVSGVESFTDYGSLTATNTTAKHSLSLYRAPSGALVFGAGTVQWSWGLDTTNAWGNVLTTPSGNPPDPTMQQATVNLFADMGSQPATLQSGLVASAKSTDTTAPSTMISSPASGASIADGTTVTVSGSAADTGGVVSAVELSNDGGSTWHPATGTTSWTYSWVAHGAPSVTLKVRAIDDSGNIGTPASTPVTITCPCSIFGTKVPALPDQGDPHSTELGVKFRSDVAGTITGIRYYKSAANTGTHVGSLWTSSGTLLAQATFSGETSSGWQQVTFSSPVAVTANTTYVAAYLAPSGHYAASSWGFNNPSPLGGEDFDNPPLHALTDPGNGNGLYLYTPSSAFPTNTYQGENYYVDVMFAPGVAAAPGQVTGVTATAGVGSATVSWTAPSTGGAPTSYKITPFIGATAQTPTTITGTPPATSTTITGLTGGTSYTFTVQAINGGGSGTVSAPSNAVTPTVLTAPGAPTAVSATAGVSAATVSWTAPSSNGGSPITSYRITPYIGATAQTTSTAAASATSATVSGLTGGTTYTFTVTAINAIGAGAESSPSNAVTPTSINPPGAPTAVSAVAQVSAATVSWTAPSSNGGSPITSYRITPYIGAAAQTTVTAAASATSAVVGSLTNGTTYTFTVTAINAIGAGAESSPSNAVTPISVTAPGAPTGVSATAQVSAAAVSWTAPSNDGGSPITGYRITPYIGASAQATVTAAASATSAVVSGLTGGTTYTFTVTAINAIGAGTESAASNAVTPISINAPGAPTAVTATAKSAGAVVGWTAPSSNGGSAITSYRITPYVGASAQATVTAGAAATSASVGGLVNGTTYTFTVTAINAIGAGAESAASSAVTPRATIFDLGVPAIVDAGDANSVELGVKFRSDVDGTINGVRFYKAAANTGSHVGSLWSATGTLLAQATFSGESASGWQQVTFSSPVSITANTTYVAGYLAPSGHYSVTQPGFTTAVDNAPLHALANATSLNGVYNYGASTTFPVNSYQASNYFVDVLFTPAAPPAVPGQPTAVSATAGLGSATVSWTAPSTGGAPTSYIVTPFIGGTAQTATTITGTPPATSTTITGLTAGTTYTFTVKAANATGSGPASSASNAVTPPTAVVPGAPTAVTATARSASAVVGWTAPGNDGGSPITGYQITPFIGAAAQASVTAGPAAASVTVPSLTNGTTYTFTVKAINAIGSGAASAASSAVVPRATIFEQGVPAVPDVADGNAVVLGVKFQSDNAGTINGIRFYKSAANTGTHVVSLWSAAGTLIAQATASGESASGWQEVTFASPAAIQANTTYVATYFAPNGHYSATGQGFAAAADSPPLHALANGTSVNGVYAYSPTNTFPFNSYNATNYSVDVMFTP